MKHQRPSAKHLKLKCATRLCALSSSGEMEHDTRDRSVEKSPVMKQRSHSFTLSGLASPRAGEDSQPGRSSAANPRQLNTTRWDVSRRFSRVLMPLNAYSAFGGTWTQPEDCEPSARGPPSRGAAATGHLDTISARLSGAGYPHAHGVCLAADEVSGLGYWKRRPTYRASPSCRVERKGARWFHVKHPLSSDVVEAATWHAEGGTS